MNKNSFKPYIEFQIRKDNKIEVVPVYTEDLRKIIQNAKKDIKDIELSLKCENETFNLSIKVSDLRALIKCSEMCTNLVPKPLSKYVVDLTQKLSQKPIAAINGRDNEIDKVWFYLSQKTRNNVFLVGPPDVGKTTIAYEVARQISVNECPKEFYDSRVLMLRPELILGIKNDVWFKYKIDSIIRFFTKNKNKIILYIDNSLYMKTDVLLISMLYKLIMKYNIPVLMTARDEQYEKYFSKDENIAKYVNYIDIEEPELKEVQQMIQNYILRLEKKYNVKISDEMIKFGIFTSDLSNSVSARPGNVINIFDKSFLEAKRKDKDYVDKKSILSCYNTYVKKYAKMSKEEKLVTAYHETGHYILTVMCDNIKDEKISCVSILPMNYWLGVTMSYMEQGEFVVYSKEYFIDHIAGLLGGRIAEKRITNANSNGASNDLAMANTLARVMVMQWGLSEGENCNRQYDLEAYYLMPESKKELIDKEVQHIINQATDRAEEIISQNEVLLGLIAEKLLEEEVLTGAELETICETYK